jgi:EmrB/QacA subfamily drug resistance transporter
MTNDYGKPRRHGVVDQQTGPTQAAAGAPEAGTGYRWLALALVLVAQFMVVLDATIVTVALPSIQRGLGFASQLDLQWVINAYVLVAGGFLLLGGRAGDLFGRKRMFLAGLALFTVASLANGLAQSPGMLIAGRAVQGLGAALVSPAVLSIIVSTFTNEGERTKALGVFSSVTAGGSATGLLLGGVLTQELSWRWIFLVNVPIGLIGGLLAARFVAHSRGPETANRRIDVLGAVTVTGGLTLFIYALVNAQTWGWGSGRFIGLVVGAAVLLAVFLATELRASAPLIRLAIFRIRSLAGANAAMFLMLAGQFVVLFFPTLYLQDIFRYSPLKTGLAFLVWPVMMIVAASIGQRLIRRFDPRLVLGAGLLLDSGGLFAFHSLPVDGSYAANVLPGMLLTAAGVGLGFSTLFFLATVDAPAHEAGLASGLINTSQQLGAALGLAVLSTIAASHTANLLHGATTAAQRAGALTSGFQVGFMIAAIFPLAAALVVATVLRRVNHEVDPEKVAPEETLL